MFQNGYAYDLEMMIDMVVSPELDTIERHIITHEVSLGKILLWQPTNLTWWPVHLWEYHRPV